MTADKHLWIPNTKDENQVSTCCKCGKPRTPENLGLPCSQHQQHKIVGAG